MDGKMALVANFHKLGDAWIVRLPHQLHQEILDAAYHAGEIESGLVSVAANGDLAAHLFCHYADAFNQSGNAAIRLRVDHFQFINLIETADGGYHNTAGLVGGTFRAGPHGLGQHGGVGINKNAIVPVFLHCLEVHTGDDFRVDAILFHADTRFAASQHKIVQAHGHTVGNPARQDCTHTLKRVHTTASDLMTLSS